MQNERKNSNSIKVKKGVKGSEKFDENGVKIRVLRESSEKNDRRIGFTQLKEHEISDDQESQSINPKALVKRYREAKKASPRQDYGGENQYNSKTLTN